MGVVGDHGSTTAAAEDGPVLQVQADPVPVVDPVRHEAGEAPLELLGGARNTQRAVPDPPRRRAGVLVRRRHEPRPELGLHGARQHARVHVERHLQQIQPYTCMHEFKGGHNGGAGGSSSGTLRSSHEFLDKIL